MQVNVEQLDPCKTQLTIEVEPEKVAKAINDVYKEYRDHMSIPGFRKGKAPRSIIERYVEPEAVKERAIELLVSPAYFEVLDEKDIHPYAEPDIDIVEYEPGKPFTFKATIPLPPKVELGEYKGIEVERRKVEVSDEDVENQIKYLQDRQSSSEKVEDRGVEANDIVIGDVGSTVEGEEKKEPKKSLIQLGENIPGFDEQILGMKPGERKTFQLQYPEEYDDKELAGKKVDFDIAIDTIRAKKVPELNAEFAKTVGGFESMEELRSDVQKKLTESEEQSADAEVEGKIIEEIISRSEICFPDVMIDHEVHHDIEDMAKNLGRQGITIDRYLHQIGKSKEEFVDDLRQRAITGIKTGLVLGEIAEKEDIDVTDEEVDAEIDKIAAEQNAPRETVIAYLDAQGGSNRLKNSMFNRKIMELLKNVSVVK